MKPGSLIIEARRRAVITQTQLAKRMGTHQSVVARWETGRTQPDFETVVRAIRACGMELNVSLDPGDDHDLTLIRRELDLLPWQRLSGMVDVVRAFAAMEAAGRARL